MEACPQYNEGSDFMGPAPMAQVRPLQRHPTGRSRTQRDVTRSWATAGSTTCGNAQNCVRVCPKEIPLTEALAGLYREATVQWFKDLFGRSDRT